MSCLRCTSHIPAPGLVRVMAPILPAAAHLLLRSWHGCPGCSSMGRWKLLLRRDCCAAQGFSQTCSGFLVSRLCFGGCFTAAAWLWLFELPLKLLQRRSRRGWAYLATWTSSARGRGWRDGQRCRGVWNQGTGV